MTPAEIDGEASSSPYDLPPNLIRVWRVYLEGISEKRGRFEETLSRDELDRASRFQFERDRRRFTMAHGALRMVLGKYLEADPKQVVFDYGPQGKPFLAGAKSDIRFNIAHSGELALIAVSRHRELGVDVEQVRTINWAEQVPERFFSPREAAVLRSLPLDLWEAAFFACWTRKEAYMKARGGGLSIPLNSFDVSLEPGKPAGLLDVMGDSNEALRWGMAELRAASGYAGALVAEGKNWNFSFFDWPDPHSEQVS